MGLKITENKKRPRGKFFTQKNKRRIFIYGFLAWPLLHFFVFWFCMNIQTFTDSFFRFSLDNTRSFVGWENYREIVKIIFGQKDRGVVNHYAILNSLSLIPLSLFINLPLTVLFAYAIYKKVALHSFFRITLFLPAVISSVVLCLSYRMALDNSSGIIVRLIRLIGLGGDGTQGNTGVIPVGGFLAARTPCGARFFYSASGRALTATSSISARQWRECRRGYSKARKSTARRS